MKNKETFSTSVFLLAAYLLAKGLKMEGIEIVPQKYYLESFFHFLKEEAEDLLRNPDKMVNFTDLKVEYDLLCMEVTKAGDEFRKTHGSLQ